MSTPILLRLDKWETIFVNISLLLTESPLLNCTRCIALNCTEGSPSQSEPWSAGKVIYDGSHDMWVLHSSQVSSLYSFIKKVSATRLKSFEQLLHGLYVADIFWTPVTARSIFITCSVNSPWVSRQKFNSVTSVGKAFWCVRYWSGKWHFPYQLIIALMQIAIWNVCLGNKLMHYLPLYLSKLKLLFLQWWAEQRLDCQSWLANIILSRHQSLLHDLHLSRAQIPPIESKAEIYHRDEHISKCSDWSVIDFYSESEYVQQNCCLFTGFDQLHWLHWHECLRISKKCLVGIQGGIHQETAYIKTAAIKKTVLIALTMLKLPF